MPLLRVNDVSFYLEDRGAGDPIILLHGFTGSSESWSAIVEDLCRTFRVITIDLIGHGKSDAPNNLDRYAYSTAMDDLALVASNLGIKEASWLGYSMGGRLALGLALRYPWIVSALILESASPGIADPDERAHRRSADNVLANRIVERGVAEFVDEWERLPMWDSQSVLPPDVLRRQRDIRLANRALGLGGSLLGMGAGAQDPLWDRLHDLKPPTLLIAGTLDTKFVGIAREARKRIPNAALHLVPEAGHAVHLERPAQYVDCVTRFISKRRVLTDFGL